MILPQDSLVRLLLNMDEVQPKLMQLILQRLAKASKEDQRAKRLPSDVNLPSLILSQVCLNSLFHSDAQIWKCSSPSDSLAESDR